MKDYGHVIKTHKNMKTFKNKFNRITMYQLMNVLLSIDKGHTVPQRVLDHRPGLGGLNQVMGPTVPLPLLSGFVAYILTSLPDDDR